MSAKTQHKKGVVWRQLRIHRAKKYLRMARAIQSSCLWPRLKLAPFSATSLSSSDPEYLGTAAPPPLVAPLRLLCRPLQVLPLRGLRAPEACDVLLPTASSLVGVGAELGGSECMFCTCSARCALVKAAHSSSSVCCWKGSRLNRTDPLNSVGSCVGNYSHANT